MNFIRLNLFFFLLILSFSGVHQDIGENLKKINKFSNHHSLLAVNGIFGNSFNNCPEEAVSADSTDTALLKTAREVLRISNEAERFWPSYWNEFPPFIIAESEKTVLLVTHNEPPALFKPFCGDNFPEELKGISYVVRGEIPDLYASRGRFDLNYVVGKDTLTAVSIQETLPGTIEFFFHEAFHAFQHRVFPERDQVEPATQEIYSSKKYREYDTIERKLLSEIISLPPGNKSRNLLRAYVTIRQQRLMNISENARDAEREIERTEGTAQLISEYAGLYLPSTEDDDTLGARIQHLLQSNYENRFNQQLFSYRSRLYGTGAALSYILDLYDTNWQHQLLEGMFLDEILQAELNLKLIQDQSELENLIHPVIK
jgi:hypothetical protein